MDNLAALLNTEEPEPEQEPEKTKGKKKKSSANILRRAQQRLAEEARQNLIRQKQENLRQGKLRIQEEWERNHAKAEKYESEFNERCKKLVRSYRRLGEIECEWKNLLHQRKIFEEWEQYRICNRLPNPASLPEMNTYIFQWTELESDSDMNYCIKKTAEVMMLLEGLEKVINDPETEKYTEYFDDMKKLRNRVREFLQENIDRAIFCLFSRLETDMKSINVTTSKYYAESPHFKISLWAELYTPYTPSTGKDSLAPLRVHFEDVDVYVVVPPSLLLIHKVMRVIWFKYDHWSDKCRTFDCPPLPAYYKQSMLELFLAENEAKLEIMAGREILERTIKARIAELPPEPTLSQEIFAWSSEPQRALSEEITYRECEEEDEMGRRLLAMLNEYEVNLRERTFLGDLLLLEMLRVPPQPKYLRYKHNVTLREEPPVLHPVDYYVKYPPDWDDDFEDKEPEHQGSGKKGVKEVKSPTLEEIQKRKLITIEIKHMPRIIWFEYPQVARWDLIRGYWTSEDIYDVMQNEETGYLTFKAGRLGLFGLHVSRYCHLPYEDWNFERNDEGGVNFYLKTAKTELYFKIKPGTVCLENMKEIPNNPLNWIFGQHYPPRELKEKLKKGGIDVFPEPDASSYVSGVTPKHVVIENNIYQTWGVFATSMRFRRSKFNQSVNRGKFVFQAHEIYKNHQVNFCLVQTELCNCYVLDIYEDSETYNPTPAPYMKPNVDLYSLLYHNSTMTARRESDVASFVLVQTIQDFLSLTRPLSFS